MKITIDTKEESKEEIKKLISFLQKLIDEENNISPEPTEGAFNMFSEDNDSSYTDIFGDNKKEEKDKEPFNVRNLLEEY